MKALGRHVVAELSQCNPEILSFSLSAANKHKKDVLIVFILHSSRDLKKKMGAFPVIEMPRVHDE